MTKNKRELKENYDHITTLKGLDGIRKRPGMYVGTTQSINGENPSGLIQLAQEALSNAIDEAYNGFGNEIIMIVHKDNSLTVIDHGRGIPMGQNMDDAIRAFTKLHSSGKFDSSNYATSGGLNGIGIKALNALSSKLEAHVITSKGEEYSLLFKNQELAEKNFIKKYSKSAMNNNEFQTGTTVTFWPDNTIFDTINWDYHVLEDKMEQSAFLTPKVKFIFIDERKEKQSKPYQKEWYSETGMPDYVSYISESEDLVKGLKAPISFNGQYQDKNKNEIDVDGALIYTEATGETIISFANGIPTNDGGPHVDGAHKGIYKAFVDYAKDKKLLKKNQKLDLSDTTDGLILALLVKIPENILMFESQSKTKLSTAVAQTAVQTVVYNTLTKWLYDHTSAAKHIIENMLDAKNAREAALKAKKVAREARKTKNNGGKLVVSEKLKRASAKKPEDKELIIVEGNSASGSIVKCRDAKTQAVFPLRGKILNVLDVNLSKALKNVEITTIANVLGAGIGPAFDVKDLQYNKVCIASDQDDDGFAIRSLCITLFDKLFPGLIENGYLYVIDSPLFVDFWYEKGKRKEVFAYSNEEQERRIKELNKKKIKFEIQRNKGLGELDQDSARKALTNPETRHLTQVTIDDVHNTKKILKLFMSKKTASERKEWVYNNIDFSVDDELEDNE